MTSDDCCVYGCCYCYGCWVAELLGTVLTVEVLLVALGARSEWWFRALLLRVAAVVVYVVVVVAN